MKILTLTTLFPNSLQPTHGIFVKRRIEAMAKLAEVKVVAPVPWVPPFANYGKYKLYFQIPLKEQQDNLEVFHPRYLITPKLGRSFYGLMYYFSLKNFIFEIKKNYNFDILDVHWAYPDGFAGVKLAKTLRTPASITIRGSDINIYFKGFIRKKIIVHTLQEADLVIGVSKDLVQKANAFGNNVKYIPNGVDIEKFRPLSKDKVRKELTLLYDTKIILSIGRLERPKRFDLLIKATNILVKHDKKFLLIIIGKGENRFKLEKLVKGLELKEHVKFVGAKPNEELVYWYNAADIVCLASDSEGCPNVLLESLACGTPVVASAVGGVPEIIHSDDYGILVKYQKPEEFAKAIKKALTKNWDKNKLIKYAQKNTWDKVADQVLTEFERIINNRQKSQTR